MDLNERVVARIEEMWERLCWDEDDNKDCPSDEAQLIKALRGVVERHKGAKRYAPYPDWEYGLWDNAEEAWEYRIDEGMEAEEVGYKDIDESKLFIRLVCGECSSIEHSVMSLNEVDQWTTEMEYPCGETRDIAKDLGVGE